MPESSLALRKIGGALSRFWSGGEGPTRAQIESALLIAGYEGRPDDSSLNKAELVLHSITSASEDQSLARHMVEELLSLLRESGYFEFDSGADYSVTRLRQTIADTGHHLTNDGRIDWVDGDRSRPQPIAEEPSLEMPTHEGVALPAVPVREVISPDLQLLISSLRRLGTGAARPLVFRRRSRTGLEVNDEYDIQDLVEHMLRLLYSDVRPEEPTPTSAGSSSRMDFFIREGRTVVEAKVARMGHTHRQIKTELLVDFNDYATRSDVDTVIAVVYDFGDVFENPSGFEHDLSGPQGRLDAHVVVVPWSGPRTPPIEA